MNGVQFKPPYTIEDTNIIKNRQELSDVSIGNWLLTFFILIIPFINIIMLCVWSFSEKINLTKRNFCRAMLIVTIIAFSIAISSFCILIILNMYNLN